MAGWTVPGYTELRTLGTGGFGSVVLARHEATGALVAIKYLRRELLTDPEFALMFRSEAELLGAMDDPNVVSLYEYIESPAGAAIVMELVDGVTLRQILKSQGATTPEAALVVLQGSLLGLATAHRRGVVHRDYKPENVLIDAAGASKLTDFGIAARAGDRPLPAGTLLYMAPEQFEGGPATPASDVYAAMATFFECLTGKPPFEGAPEELLRQHQSAPVPLQSVPEALRPLVAAGMAKDPGRRPADGRTLVSQLGSRASVTYGDDWEERGRSHLGEAALALALLWPSATPPGTQGYTIHKISMGRRITPVRVGVAVGVLAALVAGGSAIAETGNSSAVTTHTVTPTHPILLNATPSPTPTLTPCAPSPTPTVTPTPTPTPTVTPTTLPGITCSPTPAPKPKKPKPPVVVFTPIPTTAPPAAPPPPPKKTPPPKPKPTPTKPKPTPTTPAPTPTTSTLPFPTPPPSQPPGRG